MKRLIGGNLESNGYLIWDKDKTIAYVIDPGYQAARYLKEIEALGAPLQGILLTHHHYDHVGAVEAIKAETHAPVMMHIEDCDQYGRLVDRMLSDGDRLPLGDETLQVIHTPGHTHGSICFYSERSKLVFTGDTLFNVDLGRTDLVDGSLKKMKHSIRNQINAWGNEITIYPGHGDSATMKYVRTHNPEFLELL